MELALVWAFWKSMCACREYARADRGPANELANGCTDDKRLPLSSFLFTPARSSLPASRAGGRHSQGGGKRGGGREGCLELEGELRGDLKSKHRLPTAALGRFSS